MSHPRLSHRVAALAAAVLLGGLTLAPAATAADTRTVAAGAAQTHTLTAAPTDDPCDGLPKNTQALCRKGGDGAPSGGGGGAAGTVTNGAADSVRELAESLTKKISALLAPEKAWAPATPESGLYKEFLWLGEHLAIAMFICVVVVCGLTAWKGAPRMRQMGASTGWTLAAVAGMASIPGVVSGLNRAVSSAFTAAFDSDESTLFKTIVTDLSGDAVDSSNPLALLIIFSALVVALGFALLVFMCRNLGILVFVCLAPLVLASLARGGDTSAVRTWAMRLLGLMVAPFALLLVSPFVEFAKGSLVVDGALLVAADALMLRMIFHGIPYVGPRIAGAARSAVERRTDNPFARAVTRAGAPTVYERENVARGPRTVDTPGRAMAGDRGVLFAAYGVKQQPRPGRLTPSSTVARAERTERERASRAGRIRQARTAAQRSNSGPAPGTNTTTP